ncbi:radical SAM protein [Methanopyrus sp.]
MRRSREPGGNLRKLILSTLVEKGPLSRRELMDKVSGNRGLISKTVNELRDEGLIEPTHHGFVLTEKGFLELVRPSADYEYSNEPVRLSTDGPEVEAFLRVITGRSKTRTGSIVATTKCDMRCKFCYYNLVQDHIELTPKEILQEAEKRVEAGNREVVVQGASPHTLGTDLVEAVELIKSELGVSVGIGTGPLIPLDLLEDLQRAGLDYLKLSLSGRTPEEWEAITGRRLGFEEFWRLIRWCHEHGLEVTFVGGVVGIPGIPPEADAERILSILALNPRKKVIQFNPVQDPIRGPLSPPDELRRVYEAVRSKLPRDVLVKSCCVSPATWSPLYGIREHLDKVVCMLGIECREYDSCPFTGRVLEQRIMNELYEKRFMSTEELASRLRIARSRLKRRLESMESRGLIRRTENGWRIARRTS